LAGEEEADNSHFKKVTYSVVIRKHKYKVDNTSRRALSFFLWKEKGGKGNMRGIQRMNEVMS
jgi:hypothetical protein